MFSLSVSVFDNKTLTKLYRKEVLKHPSRILLESILETPNGFINRVRSETESGHAQQILIAFKIESE